MLVPYDRIGSKELLRVLGDEEWSQMKEQWGSRYDFLNGCEPPSSGIKGDRTLFNAGADRRCLEEFHIKLSDELAGDISSLQVLSLQSIGSGGSRLRIPCVCAGAVQACRPPAFPLGEETDHRDGVPGGDLRAVQSRYGLRDQDAESTDRPDRGRLRLRGCWKEEGDIA